MNYNSRLSEDVKYSTVFFVAILLISATFLLYYNFSTNRPLSIKNWIGVGAAFIQVSTLIFTFGEQVVGLQSYQDRLEIKKRWRKTSILFDSLQSAQAIESPFTKSERRFGTGGVFGYYGTYQGPEYSYKAFVTNSKKCVLISLGTENIVVSPEAREEFVSELNSIVKSKRVTTR